MRIDLSAVDPTDFFVRHTTLNGVGPVVQISPRGHKHRWAHDELNLRSLLCAPDGTVLSAGFPKFFNLGEDSSHDARATDAVARGQAWMTEKVDGSLVIRDVLAGRVHFRTRGSAALPEDRAPRIRAALERYPRLLDPACAPDRSVLLEYTSPHPDDRIIVPYQTVGLTVLGAVSHGAGLVVEGAPDTVSALAEALGVPAVRFLPVPATMDALKSAVRGWSEREGVVLRYVDEAGLGLLKLKSLRYLRNHTARFHLTRRRLWRFCWAAQVADRDALAAALHAKGLDWEIVEHFDADFADYVAARDRAAQAVDGFLAALRASGATQAADRRAAVAALRAVCGQRAEWGPLFSLGIAALDGREGARNIAVVSMIFEESQGAARHFLEKGRAAACDLTPGLSA